LKAMNQYRAAIIRQYHERVREQVHRADQVVEALVITNTAAPESIQSEKFATSFSKIFIARLISSTGLFI